MDVLVSGLSRWMKGLSPVDSTHYPAVYHGVIHTQTMIGWRHLFSGRLSKHWAILQDDFLRTSSGVAADPHNRAGECWCIEIVKVLWEQWSILWTARNKADALALHQHNFFRIHVDLRLRTLHNTINLIVDPSLRDRWRKKVNLAVPKGSKALNGLIDRYDPSINRIIRREDANRKRRRPAETDRKSVV